MVGEKKQKIDYFLKGLNVDVYHVNSIYSALPNSLVDGRKNQKLRVLETPKRIKKKLMVLRT